MRTNAPGRVATTAGPARSEPPEPSVRLRVEVRGAVQGVGFRPFVYRQALRLELSGWVLNDARGVFLEVEGPRSRLDRFLSSLRDEAPRRAVLRSVVPSWLPGVGYEGFHIEASAGDGERRAFVLPDIATCDACLAEILDPANRRHRYPFTNCTDCGPRFTIIGKLPYDRPHTTMVRFAMCPSCEGEYTAPLDRRFHAQPNACHTCGPQLALHDGLGTRLAAGDAALRRAASEISAGGILAVKGLGGFHLVVDAADEEAVARLRRRKHREAKPLALMVVDVAAAHRLCEVSAAAAALLSSPEAPIVLLPRRPDAAVAAGVAPGNPCLGVLLPPTPLHHLLLRELDRPVVATSGNRSEEPICIDEEEALERLGGIADLFLTHDRPITRHADDSVARVIGGAPQLLRRARGYAPMPLALDRPLPVILGVGGHLKNSVALTLGEELFVSQHVGDLETPQARTVFDRVVRDFLELYGARPVAIAHDLHPDYPSTRWAERVVAGEGAEWTAPFAGLPLHGVQHHHAHLAACLAEHSRLDQRALGVIWDGTGWGPDGTVWGGELLLGGVNGYQRVAALRPFRLPGGEAAMREPRRAALGLLWELHGAAALDLPLPALRAFSQGELRLLCAALGRAVNCPWTSSVGRLFDGLAALLGLRQRSSFEGQAAIELEAVAAPGATGAYPLPIATGDSSAGDGPARLDWGPLVEALVADLRRGIPVATIAARAHHGLVEAVVALAMHTGVSPVVLSGGCFQNRLLTELASRRLGDSGFEVLIHRRIPPNDGGISVGQVVVAAARLAVEGADDPPTIQ